MTAYPKPKRIKNPEYMAWIRRQHCLTCYSSPSEAHHENEIGHGAMGSKCDDTRCVPLCFECHQDRHTMGRDFWFGIDIEDVIKRLYSQYIDDNR